MKFKGGAVCLGNAPFWLALKEEDVHIFQAKQTTQWA